LILLDFSVVVPLYNEQENVRPLYESLKTVLLTLDLDSEVIFVDDGSSDETFRLLKELASSDPAAKVIKFRRNCGQTAAMAAGIDYADGDVIITMDGDLQNDPADIPLLLENIYAGHDVVAGWRYDRKDKLFSRKIPSRVANWLIRFVTGIPINDNGCSLKAFKSEIIKGVPLYSDMHRFLPAITSIAGSRIKQVKVRHHPRQYGDSKYGISRIYKVFFDLLAIKAIITSVSHPLRFFSILSLPVILLSVCLFAGAAWQAAEYDANSLPMAASGLFFFHLGLFFMLCGSFAELIRRTAHKSTLSIPTLSVSEVDYCTAGKTSFELQK
jgi:glycosyltransferase involved in cell wall biosynthesis